LLIIRPWIDQLLVFLAPMVGVTDLPFRRLAYSFGAPATVSEMVASQELASGRSVALARAIVDKTMGPAIVQIAARDPHWFAEGARIAVDAGADALDINFGCPAKKVTGGAGGAALMRDLDHARRCVAAVVAATSKPVSVKMRLGWDEDSLNAPEIAKAAQGEGACRIAVHGRTRKQFYTGSANWRAIQTTKQSVHVPVVANGDIDGAESAAAALEQSGADGVMVGRAALGQPWILGQIADRLAGRPERRAPNLGETCNAVLGFYEHSLEFYGPVWGVRMARKHLAAFIDRQDAFGDAARRREMRGRICSLDDPQAVKSALRAAYAEAAEVHA
jgi:nifR3 family TIM-barrel protein